MLCSVSFWWMNIIVRTGHVKACPLYLSAKYECTAVATGLFVGPAADARILPARATFRERSGRYAPTRHDQILLEKTSLSCIDWSSLAVGESVLAKYNLLT